MPQVPVYNQEGKRVGDMALSDAMFNVKADAGLMHEVVVATRANARKSIASTKTRGEVRGGGKKPWKQKGTGRARQGSIRSPQWIGGGIVFGPDSERNFHVKINKKAKKKVLFMALTNKVADTQLLIIDAIQTEPAKTKTVAAMLKKLPIQKTSLLVSPGANPSLMRMVRNMPNVKLVTAQSVGLLDVMKYRTLIFLKDAVPVFEKIYQA